MPVDDHPVHESTKIDAGKVYGCHNREPFAEGYDAINRYLDLPTGEFVMYARWIPHELSTDCRFDMSHTDPRCAGCKHALVELDDGSVL